MFKDSGMSATELKSLADGVIGCDFLQYFDVYFDYGHHLVYLEPNATFRRAAHH